MSDSLPSHGLEPVRLLSPWNSPGRNTGVGSHFLLQRIFLTQGLNLDLLHCRQILYQLSYQRSLVFCNSRYILHTFSSLSYLLWWPMITDLCSFMIVWGAMKWSESHSVVSDSLWPHGLYSPWNSPGQNTGVGSLSFLQGIFPTQESNWGLLHCRQILYQLSYQGSPRGHEPTLKWWLTCWIAEMITSDLDYHINFVDKAAVLWQSLSKLYLSNLVIYILSLDMMPFVKSSLIHRHASSINHQDPVL